MNYSRYQFDEMDRAECAKEDERIERKAAFPVLSAWPGLMREAKVDPVRQALRAMRAIPKLDLTERVLLDLISCVQARISESNWSHTDHGISADESLTDAHYAIEEAADEMDREAS